MKNNKQKAQREVKTTDAVLNHEQAKIAKWLKSVKFKKVIFGGVDEVDVWKKIERLNALYEAALSAERARYDALLAGRPAAGAGEPAEQLGLFGEASAKTEQRGIPYERQY